MSSEIHSTPNDAPSSPPRWKTWRKDIHCCGNAFRHRRNLPDTLDSCVPSRGRNKLTGDITTPNRFGNRHTNQRKNNQRRRSHRGASGAFGENRGGIEFLDQARFRGRPEGSAGSGRRHCPRRRPGAHGRRADRPERLDRHGRPAHHGGQHHREKQRRGLGCLAGPKDTPRRRRDTRKTEPP